MKPVMQTKFGIPDGNCFPACLASIFELPLEKIPILNEIDQNWRPHLLKWLATFGMSWTQVPAGSCWIPNGVYRIAGGPGPRPDSAGKPIWHAVVWLDDKMVHDPHPSGDGLSCSPDHYDLFLVKDPGRRRP